MTWKKFSEEKPDAGVSIIVRIPNASEDKRVSGDVIIIDGAYYLHDVFSGFKELDNNCEWQEIEE